MSTSLFLDVNVWVALAHDLHPQHDVAVQWLASYSVSTPVFFCRFTQIGLLRMLTTASAMGAEVMTQKKAWGAVDEFLKNKSIKMVDEPLGLDELFRARTLRDEVSPKLWADGYLAAFAEAGGYALATFDKALAKRVRGSVLLRGSDR